MIGRIVLLGLALLSSTGAYAQTSGRKVALVISNGMYANAGRLGNPGNDARIIAQAARQAGFDSVTLAPELSLVAFQRALRDFRSRAEGADVAMVYYAGHGIEGSGKNWLIPVDASLSSALDLAYEAVDLDRVMEAISGAKVRMVILDACRNNPFGRSWTSGTRAVTRGLGGVDVDDVLVIYAAAPGQTASDGTGGNSPFATSLARRLVQPDLPIQLLGGAVRDDVLASTQGQQRPFISASITGTPVYLVPQSAAQPKVAPAASPNVDAATLDALTWQGALNANSREAYEEYRRQYPQGRFQKLAEQNIARIGGSPSPASHAAPRPNGAITPQLLLADSSTRPITKSDLVSLTLGELRLARNEIFARHGYTFASADLRAYFGRFDWYRPTSGKLLLNPIEQRNVQLMQQEEKARGTRN